VTMELALNATGKRPAEKEWDAHASMHVRGERFGQRMIGFEQ